MPDKNIEQLPLLSQGDFNFSTDYIIVQKPGGATYKMIAGQALADISSGSTYVDAKTSTINGLSSSTIEFNAKDLLSQNTAWKMDFVFRVASLQRYSNHTFTGASEGDVRFYSVIKSEDSNLIGENNIGGSSSIKVASFVNGYVTGGRSSQSGNATLNYFANINTSLGVDLMRLTIDPSFIYNEGAYNQSTDQSLYRYYSSVGSVELNVSIFANLRA